jgi:hypothetical protein
MNPNRALLQFSNKLRESEHWVVGLTLGPTILQRVWPTKEIVKQVVDWLAIIHNRNEPNLAGLRLLGRKVKLSKISLFTTDFHECIECYQTTRERIIGFSTTQIHQVLNERGHINDQCRDCTIVIKKKRLIE